MLDNLRANKGGIITYVFLFAIIIVFVVSFGLYLAHIYQSKHHDTADSKLPAVVAPATTVPAPTLPAPQPATPTPVEPKTP